MKRPHRTSATNDDIVTLADLALLLLCGTLVLISAPSSLHAVRSGQPDSPVHAPTAVKIIVHGEELYLHEPSSSPVSLETVGRTVAAAADTTEALVQVIIYHTETTPGGFIHQVLEQTTRSDTAPVLALYAPHPPEPTNR